MFINLFLRILSVFILVFLGGVARKTDVLDAESTRRLSTAVKNFFYPALIFHTMFNNFTSGELMGNWLLPAGAFMIMVTGYCWGLLASRFILFKRSEEKSSFLFQCAINNYSFLPLPIVLMLWGGEGVAMLIFSTLGSEIAVWTVGVFALSGNRFQRRSLKNLASVPMLSIVCAIAAVLARDYFSGLEPAQNGVIMQMGVSSMYALELLGGATIPLALLVVGSRILVLESRHILSIKQVYTAALRLLLIPATSALLLFLLPIAERMRLVLLVVAIMPSANASVILSEAYGTDVDFAASSVLVTHLFSLFTIPLWLSFFLR